MSHTPGNNIILYSFKYKNERTLSSPKNGLSYCSLLTHAFPIPINPKEFIRGGNTALTANWRRQNTESVIGTEQAPHHSTWLIIIITRRWCVAGLFPPQFFDFIVSGEIIKSIPTFYLSLAIDRHFKTIRVLFDILSKTILYSNSFDWLTDWRTACQLLLNTIHMWTAARYSRHKILHKCQLILC